MFTSVQVSQMLDLPLPVLRQYVTAFSSQLSPDCQLQDGGRFTEADVAILSRARAHQIESHTVVIKCAWCGKELGIRQGYGMAGARHGICGSCASRLLSDYELAKEPLRG